jgi:predicted DNA-binding transcriptional regulator AlpA
MREQYLDIAELKALVPHPKHVVLAMVSGGGFPPPVARGRGQVWRPSDVESWIKTPSRSLDPSTDPVRRYDRH